MADRFSTPPRRTRALVPPSPISTTAEMNVSLVAALTGVTLGRSKVTSATRLLDIRPSLVAAMGGGLNLFEVHLVSQAGTVYDKAFSKPFEGAAEGDVFGVVKVKMEDMVYLDMGDRRK